MRVVERCRAAEAIFAGKVYGQVVLRRREVVGF
jgi:hypothetical protein